MGPRSDLADQELQDTLRVIGYEVGMLNFAVRRLAELSRTGRVGCPRWDQEWNMALECFCLHARVLYEFFYQPRAKRYIRVQNLLGKAGPLCKPTRFGEHMDKMNNLLAHLTLDRLRYVGDPAKKQWPIACIVANLKEAVARFHELASKGGIDTTNVPKVPS